MSTDEERAALLRAIASGGFSPYDDSDGSTANTLYGWADEIAQVARVKAALWNERPRTDVHKKGGFLYRFWRRAKARRALRRKMRLLGMIP